MGCSQAVRQLVLIQSCDGSNPSSPAIFFEIYIFIISLYMIKKDNNNNISKNNLNSTSKILNNIYDKNIKDNIEIGDLLKSIESGGFALLNLIFSLLLIIPTPPPVATISGIIIIFLSFQMMIGVRSVWLPNFIMSKSIKRTSLSLIVEKSSYYLYKLERFTRRRFTFTTHPIAEKIIGFFIFILAVITLTPVIFANSIPGSAIFLISFGLVNRDGLVVIFGFLVGFFSMYAIWKISVLGTAVVLKMIDKFIPFW